MCESWRPFMFLLAVCAAGGHGLAQENKFQAALDRLDRAQKKATDARQKEELQREADALKDLAATGIVGSDLRTCQNKKFVITGVVEITADTTIRCRDGILSFGKNAVLRISNGAIVFLDVPRIEVSPDGGARIDGRGNDGGPGPAGADKGEWSSQGDDDYWRARNENNPNDHGGDGGNGRDGENGAVLILRAAVPDGLTIEMHGGAAGKGGRGGHGKLLKNGRNNYCDGCMWGAPDGNPGQDGKAGLSGGIIPLVPQL